MSDFPSGQVVNSIPDSYTGGQVFKSWPENQLSEAFFIPPEKYTTATKTKAMK